LGYAERAMQFTGGRTSKSIRRAWVIVAAACALIVMGYLYSGPAAGRIAVGSKDFSEQVILGEILAQAIEAETGLKVERRFDLGGNLAHEALVAGEIDVYPEYTGTALLAILRGKPLKDPREVYRVVADEYARRFDLVWSEPLGFNNTFAILVRAEDARRLNLKTISDAARVSGQWRAGFGQDFMSRADGYPGFAKTYGFHFQEIREMELALTYRALAEKQVDLIAGNSTDGLITRYGLAQLEDDRSYFPPYDAVPVARRALLDKHPRVRQLLQRLGGTLTVDEMRKLNYAVDGEKRQPKDVAREFLTQKKITPQAGSGS
jgi:glycine betaine/choline ABC-type transport system substrate-binding protein